MILKEERGGLGLSDQKDEGEKLQISRALFQIPQNSQGLSNPKEFDLHFKVFALSQSICKQNSTKARRAVTKKGWETCPLVLLTNWDTLVRTNARDFPGHQKCFIQGPGIDLLRNFPSSSHTGCLHLPSFCKPKGEMVHCHLSLCFPVTGPVHRKKAFLNDIDVCLWESCCV